MPEKGINASRDIKIKPESRLGLLGKLVTAEKQLWPNVKMFFI